jgi:hypothetical protein
MEDFDAEVNEDEIQDEVEVTVQNSVKRTPKQLAAELGLDPKTLRRIMRSLAAETPGQGGRWEIDSDFEDAIRNRVSRSHNRKVVSFRPKSVG